MEKLVIDGDNDRPYIYLDKEFGIYRIRGCSLPENVLEVYTPVLDWLREYAEDPNPEMNFEFDFDYLNTASSNMVMRIIDALINIRKNQSGVQIKWFYRHGDIDMRDLGLEMLEDTKCTFKLIQKDPVD
ncbi:MAG: DUF1987 domain-containing protein [Bacteroidales bacterium]|nr:DUF1987 domain-containing protein [Bacteroidales bacterium]